jgi:hypothetical protein
VNHDIDAPEEQPGAPVARNSTLDAIVAACLMVLALVVIVEARRLGAGWTTDGPGAGYFPFYVGLVLLGSGAAIFVTNIIVFGIWYWELDRGGPFARRAGQQPFPDFLFPQMTDSKFAKPDWHPKFVDYLYVSLTNVMAFSPTDTMPLARWAKVMMAVQAMVALSTAGLVIARAVNVLG